MNTNIKISYPFKRASDGVEVSEIFMRRPIVRDLRRMQNEVGNQAEQEIFLIANLCGMSPADIDCMDGADYMKLQKNLQGFLSPSET